MEERMRKFYRRDPYGNTHRVNVRDGYTCALCLGSVANSRYRHTHHIDQDPRNGDPRNLATVCAGCHRRIHLATDNKAAQLRAILTEWAVGQELIVEAWAASYKPQKVRVIIEINGQRLSLDREF